MQTIFSEITVGDIDAVRQRVQGNPGSVRSIATGDSEDFAGYSPLMSALIAGEFEIAELLLDHGADVDFVDEANWNSYARPVLHDAITAATLRSLPPRRERQETAQTSTASFAILRRMLEQGANVAAMDSQGNTSLFRAAGDAWQVLLSSDLLERLDPEFTTNLARIFELLIAHGADPHHVDLRLGKSVAELYRGHLIGTFLDRQGENRFRSASSRKFPTMSGARKLTA
ncbi:ankyrin repeat domain-containing protein [Arthrobacter sp. NPDC090010]|uniref:ankyrin repeat domain-containing protein n=1 Tax=Arthrobacter sp. NPDC090010 TaxID=3363942 RepID=UPI00380DA36D